MFLEVVVRSQKNNKTKFFYYLTFRWGVLLQKFSIE